MELTEEARASIFKEPLKEIVRMLEQNLLDKFVLTQERSRLDMGEFVDVSVRSTPP